MYIVEYNKTQLSQTDKKSVSPQICIREAKS